ncbi:MAG: hypothetical protein ACLRZ9_07185 [Eubacterium sp.]
MMIDGKEILLYLYYTIHIPEIFNIINIIIGIMIGFFAYKFSRKFVANIIGAYFGTLFGGMVGYIIWEHWISICIGSVIGILVFLFLGKLKKGNIFIISFTFFMQVSYILINALISWIGVDFYELMGNYRPDLLIDYLAKDFAVIVSVIVGIFCGIIMTRVKYYDEIYFFLCSFIGAIQLVGILGSSSYAPFIMGGEWEDFFIPMMNMEYGCYAAWFFLVIFIVAGFLCKFQMKRMGKYVINEKE